MRTLEINGLTVEVDVEDDTPLLWVIRDAVGLTGTKYGCGIAHCGACTIHINGQPVRSCTFPISALKPGAQITTIEGIGATGLTPVQQAWIEEQVPQCGYCQSGQIMAATALLKDIPQPTDDDIDRVMTNLCRCGTYPRIRKAIHRAAQSIK